MLVVILVVKDMMIATANNITITSWEPCQNSVAMMGPQPQHQVSVASLTLNPQQLKCAILSESTLWI